MFEVELFNYHNQGVVVEWGTMLVEASCPTDLANQAYKLQKEFGAEHVTFGRAIEREDDGSIAYGKRSK